MTRACFNRFYIAIFVGVVVFSFVSTLGWRYTGTVNQVFPVSVVDTDGNPVAKLSLAVKPVEN